MSAIPIENLYWLLGYAWNQLEERDLVDVSTLPKTQLADLFARVLAGGVTHVLKRGLDRAYTTTEDEIAGIRGRLDLSTSIKRATFTRARAWCAFDELTPDVLHNRIVKATLRQLASVDELERENAERLKELYRRMDGAADIGLTSRLFGQVTLGRNNAYYGFLLQICALVHRNLLVHESTGRTTFRDFTRDDDQMARLFERFVFNFYRKEQRAYRVRAIRLRWAAEGDADHLALLPGMRTDIVLHSRRRTIVIDTKYCAQALQEYHGHHSVRSGHLYQLFAYLTNLRATGLTNELRGMLLYPRTVAGTRIAVRLQGFPVDVCTIDLAQPWRAIHDEMLSLVGLTTSTAPAARPRSAASSSR